MDSIGVKSIPYEHQLQCFNLSKDREAFAIFTEQGTGKCLMVLMTAAHLYKTGKISRLCVVAPRGCYRVWSDDEVQKHLREDLPYRVAYWSSQTTKQSRKQLGALEDGGKALRVLVVNVEAFLADRTMDFVTEFLDAEPSLLVVDESTIIKNPQAKRTKILINVGKHAKYRRICSGNPIPNGVCDLWAQTEFLKKNLMGFTNFYAFRNRFCVITDQRFGAQSFKKIVGYRDMDALKKVMSNFSFVVKKIDCLDLPPKVYEIVDVEMGPKQRAAYETMVNDAFIKLDGMQVTAQLVMTQLTRLHQIACGFLKPDDEPEMGFDEPNHRVATLLEILEQAPGKVIIWANYRHNIEQIVHAISEKFGKGSVVSYYGDTDSEDRYNAKVVFQDMSSEVRFIVSNPSTGKFGNTWTAATTVVYFSNSYNLEDRDQSEDRAHRIGQAGALHGNELQPSVLYVDLRARGTVDDKIIKVLRSKKKLTDEVVCSNWRWLLERNS